MKIFDIIQEYFSCYETSDKRTLEKLLDDKFEFSSPHDNKLDKSSYFEKCWGFKPEPARRPSRFRSPTSARSSR